MSARNKTVSTGFAFEGAKFSSRIPADHDFHGVTPLLWRGGNGKSRRNRHSCRSARKNWMERGRGNGKKKERKGKRAMKPRRKNGINSLPFFFEIRTSKCRVGQKKYSDLYCLKILFDKSAKIFIITYGFINFLLTQFSKRLHESKIQISSGRKKVQRKWRGRGTKRRIVRWTKMTKHRLS